MGRAVQLLCGGPATHSPQMCPSPSYLTLPTPGKIKTILIKAPQPKTSEARVSQKGKG